jgi:hypothetical protein
MALIFLDQIPIKQSRVERRFPNKMGIHHNQYLDK